MPLRCERKIASLEQLERQFGTRSQVLVHCHGCFDLLHPGHVHHFEFARSLGDLLLVSLNDDAHFVDKGPGRPIFSERLRAIAIASLEAVDYVCIYPGFVPEILFERLRPDIYVKGIEYDFRRGEKPIPEEAMVSAWGGRVMYGPTDEIYSSSRLIEQIAACQRR